MMVNGLVLFIPAKPDPERDAVARAWEAGGGSVLRVDRFWEPPEVDRDHVRLYGNDTFCLVLAQKLGLQLISPPDELLVTVDASWLQREVHATTLERVVSEAFPRFIKPLVPKLFGARVYAQPAELAEECKGLAGDTPVLSSEVVELVAEARAFVLDGQVLTCALYEGEGSAREAKDFVAALARSVRLPRTCVVDAALIRGRGWALLETNATWGAGLNGCEPSSAVACIAEAIERMG